MTPDTPATSPASACGPVSGYAAGPGYPAPALNAAAQAGWTRFQDEVANVTYTSPDQRARVQFGPETVRYARSRDRLWRVAYTAAPTGATSGQVHWEATFGDNTPAEAIAAFLTALAQLAGHAADGAADTPRFAAGPGDPASVYEVCDQAGWALEPHLADDCRLSADTTMRLTYRAPHPDRRVEEAGWQAAYRPIDNDRRWSARFTPAVPAAAIAAFIRVLTDPAGLDPERA